MLRIGPSNCSIPASSGGSESVPAPTARITRRANTDFLPATVIRQAALPCSKDNPVTRFRKRSAGSRPYRAMRSR
ncbi:Uncharacterised protein [Mycobacteroides abscessus subsp. abscessus]|nr:Uncharacterised protein [Mycobacteroides abscessus subsp. abscessus]